MGCEHITELGGLRGKAKNVPSDVNGFWENQSFHFADQALTEAVWWRCHRRLVTDIGIAGGQSVFHLMGKNKIEPAKLTVGARISKKAIVTYPAGGSLQDETKSGWL